MTHDHDHDPATDATDSAADDQPSVPDRSLGMPIPDEYAGAFVAEVFEDPERDVSWADVVDAMVAEDAREAWDSLGAKEQVVEVLESAREYDHQTVALLEAIDLDHERNAVPDDIEEALRCRRNADAFRTGIADAFAQGRVTDDELLAAVEASGFETSTIADREAELERVADAYDIDFRPYGGTLMDTEETSPSDESHSETW